MSANGARPIIIKRKKAGKHKFHGGGWKIALADFMTAMMALFLVLWLISTSSDAELEGIAEYFSTPLKVAMAGGDRLTSSNSAIPGGGTDPVHINGERARIDLRQQTRPADIQRRFTDLQRRIQEAILADPELIEIYNQLRMYLVPEGLLIQLLDTEQRPMFELGSANVEPYMERMLRTIAPLLNELPNRLSISGHTDSVPYQGENRGYSNWELSSDRANASRRELMAGGMNDAKLVRVVGMADQVSLPFTEPEDPVNRRIELMVLEDFALERINARHRTTKRDELDGH